MIKKSKVSNIKGYLSTYNIDLPIISDTNSLVNEFRYRYSTELYNENVSSRV